MVTRHRHTESEIAAKLKAADGMAAQGVLHRDIAKLLGISVMTYHRWRKARGAAVRSMLRLAADADRAEIPADREEIDQIRALKIENSRLRRLVTDLLLEKLELEESFRGVVRGPASIRSQPAHEGSSETDHAGIISHAFIVACGVRPRHRMCYFRPTSAVNRCIRSCASNIMADRRSQTPLFDCLAAPVHQGPASAGHNSQALSLV